MALSTSTRLHLPRKAAWRLAAMVALVALLASLFPAAGVAGGPAQVGQGPVDGRERGQVPAQAADRAGPAAIDIEIASGRADTITGGDALVRLHLRDRSVRGVHDVEVLVTHDGGTHDVSDAFELESGRRSMLGLVKNLPEGEAKLQARSVNPRAPGAGQRGRAAAAELELTNHPDTGPVFSGPHQQPFRCDEADRSGLLAEGEEYDEFCHVETPAVEYYYLPDDVVRGVGDLEFDDFVRLDGPDDYPDDVAMTETTEGVEVPFIVRNERGTLNRGVYNIAVLHDPDQAEWGDPLNPQPQWNERLFYQLEGACRPGYMQHRERAQDILDGGEADALAHGFGVARHTFTRHGNACGNDVLSAESMMMVREHFTTTHGEPLHMIGNGTSGGPIQMHLIADNYPGILDGIIAGSTFPDAYSIASGGGDAPLLHRAALLSEHWDEYDEETASKFPGEWSPAVEEQLAGLTAAAGFGSWAINMTWIVGNTRNVDPSVYVGDQWDEDELYDEETGEGVRATIYEAGVNTWGRDPDTGYARRPLDNTGVQYGLEALEDGVIDEERFVVLNELAGGFDINANHISERMDISEELAALAYQSGRVVNAGEGLAEVPILAWGGYQDTVELGADYHDRFRDFTLRARLEREQGHFANHVMWHTHPFHGIPEEFATIERLLLMDEWVTNLGEHDGERDAAAFGATRPEGMTDRCWTSDGSHHEVTQWPHDDTDNPCIEDMPPAGDPRIAAGAPMANDIIKCQTKPLDFDDYGEDVEFSAEQRQRLEDVFATGVCDWSQPGVGQQPPLSTWLSYDEPGNPQPLE